MIDVTAKTALRQVGQLFNELDDEVFEMLSNAIVDQQDTLSTVHAINFLNEIRDKFNSEVDKLLQPLREVTVDSTAGIA